MDNSGTLIWTRIDIFFMTDETVPAEAYSFTASAILLRPRPSMWRLIIRDRTDGLIIFGNILLYYSSILTAYINRLASHGQKKLIEEPQRREAVIENIERQKEQLLVNILGPR